MKQINEGINKALGIPASVLKQAPSPIRYDAIFGVRSLRSGNFKGLWELVQLDEKGNRKVLTDANSRGMIITMINRQIMKIVVMQ